MTGEERSFGQTMISRMNPPISRSSSTESPRPADCTGAQVRAQGREHEVDRLVRPDTARCRRPRRSRGGGARGRSASGPGRSVGHPGRARGPRRPRARTRPAPRARRALRARPATRCQSSSLRSTSSTITLKPARAVLATQPRYPAITCSPTGPMRRSITPSTKRNAMPSSACAPMCGAVGHPLRRELGEHVVDPDHEPARAGVGEPGLEPGCERRLAGARRAVEHDHPTGAHALLCQAASARPTGWAGSASARRAR